MDIFTTSISGAIHNQHLKEGSFACDKQGRLIAFGAFSRKAISKLTPEMRDKFFGINSQKLSKLILDYRPETPLEKAIFEDNVNYLKAHGFIPVENSSKESQRFSIKKAWDSLPKSQ